jgi:microcystin-dependent protein
LDYQSQVSHSAQSNFSCAKHNNEGETVRTWLLRGRITVCLISAMSLLSIVGATGTAQKAKAPSEGSLEELKKSFSEFKLSSTKNAEVISSVSQTAPPVGGIIAYGGSIDPQHRIPADWMECNGAPLSKSDYPELFAVIGVAHGDGRDDTNNKVPGTDFNLPDLRGYFLRGVDGLTARDPDASRRTAPRTGGNTGTGVGSFQGDTFQRHTHVVVDPGHTHVLHAGFLADGNGGYGHGGGGGGSDIHDRDKNPMDPATTGIKLGESGETETRPKNVAVYWIVRVR